MDFEADLLAVPLSVGAEKVEGFANLFDGFFVGDALVKAVGLDLDSGATDVVAEADEILSGFDGFFKFVGVGVVKIFVAADTDECDRAVSEASSDVASLLLVEKRFDTVGVRGAEFDAEDAGLLAIGNEGG